MRLSRDRHVTIVSFHAHPDDEAILTGGTLAQLSSAGHRVVLVVATSGEAGLAASAYQGEAGLGRVRTQEVHASARVLGVARVVLLGYADSGYPGSSQQPGDVGVPGSVGENGVATRFADVDVEPAARRLADILREEHADVLTTYDRNGGYGHPDHVQVHHVGARAAEVARTPLVLEATMDRTALVLLERLLRPVSVLFSLPRLPADRDLYCSRSELTHCIDVRAVWSAKRSAMAAHVSQATADREPRTLALLLLLPRWAFRLAFRYEWFREAGMAPGSSLSHDLLQSLRAVPWERRQRQDLHGSETRRPRWMSLVRSTPR